MSRAGRTGIWRPQRDSKPRWRFPRHLAKSVFPVDLPEDSEVRKSFSASILVRQVSSVIAYWQFMIFSGRATPQGVCGPVGFGGVTTQL